jgi:hypothetical protein
MPRVYVRVTRGRYRPSRFDSIEKLAEELLVPALRQLPGFRGFTGAADRAGGTLVAISYWDTAEQAGAAADQRRPFEELDVRFEAAELYEVIVED